jgi:NADPH:quinone reductase-like Zn-dependent oxidoreductase
MKAIIFDQIGKANDVLKLEEILISEPNDNEVRIKILASTINPADMLFIEGKYRMQPSFPQTAGLEGVGIIDKTGRNIQLPKNTLVAFRHKNIWAEYAVMPEEKIVILPQNFPIDKGSQFSLNPITAYALLEQANIKESDWLLLTAGNSAISKIIIQLARQKNINIISVVRKSTDFDELKSLGVTAVFLSDSATLLTDIQSLTNGKGLNCILDAVGGQLMTDLLKSLAPFGQLISYGLLDKENVNYHNSNVIFKNITIKGFGVDAWLQSITQEEKEKMHKFLIVELQKDDFKLPVAAHFKLTDFAEAITEYYNDSNKGKILLINK